MQTACDVAKKIIQTEKGFNIHTNGSGKKVKDAGLSAVAGSDAHNPDILWDNAVETSIKTLAQLGINRIEKIKL